MLEKLTLKKNEMATYITDDLEVFCDDSDHS